MPSWAVWCSGMLVWGPASFFMRSAFSALLISSSRAFSALRFFGVNMEKISERAMVRSLLGAGEDAVLFVAAMGRWGLDVLTRDGDVAGGRNGAGGIADVAASLVGRRPLVVSDHPAVLGGVAEGLRRHGGLLLGRA